MAKKNLNDVGLVFSALGQDVCIGQKNIKNPMFCDNKKVITQEFLNMMMLYCHETCKGKELEWESQIGTIKFIPKIEENK